MIRYIGIERCVDCKHISPKFSICLKEERTIPDITTIPKWCPLPIKTDTAAIAEVEEKEFQDLCPKCNKKLILKYSGVKCPDEKCGYWFCY